MASIQEDLRTISAAQQKVELEVARDYATKADVRRLENKIDDLPQKVVDMLEPFIKK